MAHTAPQGYDSNHHALIELIRFAPAIWPTAQFIALLFHAERSVVYGKDADEHSENQAIEGIYSSRQLAWVRGPAGLSRATWYRANAELAIDPEAPARDPNRVIRKRRGGNGRGEIVEYEIDWQAVKNRIRLWKEGSQSETLPEQKGSQSETLKGPNLRPIPGEPHAEKKGPATKEGSQSETRQSTLTLKSDSNSRSVGIPTRASIDLELEIACGERPRTARPSTEIIEAATKLSLPHEAIARFIHEKAGDFRARNYPFHAGLIATSFGQEAIKWIRQNRDFVGQCQTRAELAKQAGALKQMPAAEPASEADPDFARQLLASVRTAKGAGQK